MIVLAYVDGNFIADLSHQCARAMVMPAAGDTILVDSYIVGDDVCLVVESSELDLRLPEAVLYLRCRLEE